MVSDVQIAVNAKNNFDLDRFHVETSLLGASHIFQFEGKNIRLQLPKDESPREESRPAVKCVKWKSSGMIPLEYAVRRISLELEIDESITIPAALLRLPPTQYDLVTNGQAQYLDALVDGAGGTLGRAFDHWIKTLRWKSGIGHIGEPSVSNPGGNWSAAISPRGTIQRIWVQTSRISVYGNGCVSQHGWDQTQAALTAGKSPPVWFDFLFDCQMRMNNNDLVGAVLSLAIALEVNLRRLFSDDLQKADVHPVILEVFDLTNMRALLSRLKKTRYWAELGASSDISAFHKLMDYRDGIMHRAKIEELDGADLKKLHAAVKVFAYASSKALGLE